MLAVAAYWAVRLAWADHLSAGPRVEDRRRAVLLAPLDATFYSRLAEKLGEEGGNPLPGLEAAARLDPDNPEWRTRLGQQAELAGDLGIAEGSLAAAARLSRQYQPKYLLAGYYLRRGNADLCIRWSQAALAVAPGDVTPVLNLLANLWDGQTMAADGIREPRTVARQILTFLARRGQTAAAGSLAQHLAETATDEDLPVLLDYTNQLLDQGHGLDAARIWNLLCARRRLPYSPLDVAGGRSLTNADFRRFPLGSGFDWRVENGSGVHVGGFDGALRATFSGDQADDCVLMWQYVLLEPGGRYRLRQEVRTDDPASAAGLRWRLFYRRNGPGWDALDSDLGQGFRAPGEVGKLTLMYRRASGSTRLTGDVSLTGLRLEREP